MAQDGRWGEFFSHLYPLHLGDLEYLPKPYPFSNGVMIKLWNPVESPSELLPNIYTAEILPTPTNHVLKLGM